MLNLRENLQFKADIKFVSKKSPCFKSKDYPPKNDFVMSVDKSGEVISRYGDDIWNFRSFENGAILKFEEYDNVNKPLFKMIMYYIIYSHLFPSKYASLKDWYNTLQLFFRYCHANKIKVNELNRYPKAIEEIAKKNAQRAPASFKKKVFHLNKFLKNHEQIGFVLLNEKNIALFGSFNPNHEHGQTAYIPVRIWTNLIKHLDSIFDDFNDNQKELEKLYHYLSSSYISNRNNGIFRSSPFGSERALNKVRYGGSFEHYLKKNSLLGFFERHVERSKTHGKYTALKFSELLNNIMLSAFIYVIYYSLMRRSEASSLRTDCLIIETDARLGEFFLLKGETTKTDPDSDDRWVVCDHVERAVSVANTLLSWKLKYIEDSEEVHHIFQKVNVWQRNQLSSKARDFSSCRHLINRDGGVFFNTEQYRITQDDYKEALALTPSLAKEDWFKVGNIWQFGFHQFRRTLAVHFALNKVSPSSTQLQMKHRTRVQQFHYQNNTGRLRLNNLSEQEVVSEHYAEMARNISSAVYKEDVITHSKFTAPQEIVHFIETGDMEKLLKAQKNGMVGYRRNLLGGCMKQGSCKYGGFDSISHCAGGNRKRMCSDLVIDTTKKQEFEQDKAYYEEQMKCAPNNSPRHQSLKAEVKSYKKILKIIKDEKDNG